MAAVEARLRDRHQACLRVDPSSLPGTGAVNFQCGSRSRGTLSIGGERFPFEEIGAAWYRQGADPRAAVEVQESAAREYVEADWRQWLADLWLLVPASWVPARPVDIMRAQLKAHQLCLASRLGFAIPPTLITDQPDEVREFLRRHDGQVISKVLGTGFSTAYGDHAMRYTERVRPRDRARLDAVRHCPMIFQAEVEKSFEVRATVVGRQVLAAAIHSQASSRTSVDWRRYDKRSTPYEVHDLPVEIRRLCLDMTAALGLRYGAFDFVVTPRNEYVFLEVNPAGQFGWIEEATGLAISDAICDLLIELCQEAVARAGS